MKSIDKIDKIYEKYPSFKKDVESLKKEAYRKTTDKKLKKAKELYESKDYGSVKKILSKIDIRLISKNQKTLKEKYELISKRSSYYKFTSFFSILNYTKCIFCIVGCFFWNFVIQ